MDQLFSSISFYEIFIQVLGIIGIIASILSFQCKDHKRLMILRTVNEMFFAVQYGLLGAFTGMLMNLIGSTRNLVFAKMVEQKKDTKAMRVLFSVLFLVFVFFTWDGFKSILVGVAKVISTIAYGCNNTFIVRVLVLFTSSSWLIYNLSVGSLAGAVCEALTLISIVVALIRIDLPELIH